LHIRASVFHLLLEDFALEFAAALRSRKFADVLDSRLKLASEIACGSLERHPIIQGLLISTIELCRRKDKGLTTMRSVQYSDQELQLVSDAGAALACLGLNKAALSLFGLSHRNGPQELSRFGATASSLSIVNRWQSLENFNLLEGLLPKHVSSPSRPGPG
jgi:hypothetical protein